MGFTMCDHTQAMRIAVLIVYRCFMRRQGDHTMWVLCGPGPAVSMRASLWSRQTECPTSMIQCWVIGIVIRPQPLFGPDFPRERPVLNPCADALGGSDNLRVIVGVVG